MRSVLLYTLLLGCSTQAAAQHVDASIGYHFGQGGWSNYYTPKRSISWSGQVKTSHTLNPRTIVGGEVAYTYLTGYEMAGSAWIDPTDKPFNLLEYTEGREGRKVLEQYQLGATIRHQIGSATLGLDASYQTANYAKQRDLRHQNRLMQLQLKPQLLCSFDLWDVGAVYTYRRRTEGVSFNVAGNTDQQYISLVSYGAFLGMREYSATLYDGYTSTSSGDRPLVDQWQGLTLQTEFHPDNVLWHNAWSWEHRTGYYGRETTYTIVYEDHEGNHLSWVSTLGIGQLQKQSWRHQFCLQVEYTTLQAKERLWNEVQQGGGLTEYVYYDHQQRLEHKNLSARLNHLWQLQAWTLQTQVHFWHQQQMVSYYPRFRKQTLNQYALLFSGSRLWQLRKHQWQATLSLGWQQGNGTPADDGTYNGVTATTRVVSHDRYLQQDFLYHTAQVGQMGVNLRYSHPQRWYLMADYHLQHAIEGNPYDSPSFNNINFTIGYKY